MEQVVNESYKEVFANRSIEDFQKNGQQLQNIKTGSRLGWDGKFNPEVYGPSTSNISRWVYSWDKSRSTNAYGYKSALIAIEWATAYMEVVKESNSGVVGKFQVLANEYSGLAGQLTRYQSTEKASQKTKIAELFNKAAGIMNGEKIESKEINEKSDQSDSIKIKEENNEKSSPKIFYSSDKSKKIVNDIFGS